MADIPLVKSPVPLDELAGASVATAGQVPTADGLGGAAWETPAGAPAAADVSIADAGGYFTGADVEAALQELGAGSGGGGGASGYDPDAVPASPNAENDEFDDGTVAAKWGWSTGTAPTLVSESTYAGRLMMQVQPAASALYFRQPYVPGAATAFTIAAKLAVAAKYNDNASIAAGLAVLDASDAAIARLAILSDGAAATTGFHRMWDGATAYSMSIPMSTWVYLAISRDTANAYRLAWSLDGQIWNVFQTPSSATAVAKVGLWVNNSAGSADRYLLVDWFRRFSSSSFPFVVGQ